MNLLLALDVGNTSVTAGLFRGRRLIRRGRFPTSGVEYPKELKPFVLSLSKDERLPRASTGSARTVAIISSVVPKAAVLLKKALKSVGCPVFVVGRDLQAPVKNRYRIPAQVGQDRLVNAAAAFHLYGGPAIVVDFGTAVTVDLVSAKREYLGGLIAPGMEISLEALVERTALLPGIPLVPPKEFLGRDTATSMRAGLFYGYAALCDGLITRLKKEYAPRAKVIATGGHVRLIAPLCRFVQIVNPDLTLWGLELTYRKKIC